MSKITTGQMYQQWEQMNQKLEAMEQKLDSVIENDAVNTQLTGSIEEEYVFRDHQIRDTNTHSVVFDLTKYKNFYIFAYHTHDVDLQIRLRFPRVGGGNVGYTESLLDNNGERLDVARPKLERNYNYYLSSGSWGFLNNIKVGRLQFNLTSVGASPTSGDVNLIVFGEVYK